MLLTRGLQRVSSGRLRKPLLVCPDCNQSATGCSAGFDIVERGH